MTKLSGFRPAKATETKSPSATSGSSRTLWVLRILGLGALSLGWLAVALNDYGGTMFIVDTAVFLAMAVFAFTAAAVSRKHAVSQERKLRLRLLVHNMELENMITRDKLTQLFNRRYLFERLEREIEAARGFQRPLAFIAIELRSLDHFNHTYGYAAGDLVLAAFGKFLMDGIRATDIPARMSGNKFGVILPDTSKRGAYTMVERLAHSLAATPLLDDAGLNSAVVASFGVSGYPWAGSDSVDAIVRQAETEMAAQSGPQDNGATGQHHDPGPTDEMTSVSREFGEAPKDA